MNKSLLDVPFLARTLCQDIECTAYWSLDTNQILIGPGGGGYADLTGGGATMIPTAILNAPDTGIIGTAQQFTNGSGKWLQEDGVNPGTRLDDNEWSITCWVNFDSFPNQCGIVDQTDAFGAVPPKLGQNWTLIYQENALAPPNEHVIIFRKWRPDNFFFDDVTADFDAFRTAGIWTHIVVVRRFLGPGPSDFQQELWFNGNLVATGPSTLEPSLRLIPTNIGVYYLGLSTQDTVFPGRIDEVGIANVTAWTETQIKCLYNRGRGRRPVGLIPALAAPALDPDTGTAPLNVDIHAPLNATLHYTTDGEDPTVADPNPANPFSVAATTELKVIAAQPGYLVSPIATGIYETSLGVDCRWYYNLGDAGGGAVSTQDSMLNHLTLAPGITDVPTWDAGVGAAKFVRASQQYLFHANDALFSIPAAFTVVAWARLASKPGGGQMIVLGRFTTVQEQWVLFYHTPTDRFYFLYYDTANAPQQITYATLGSPTIGAWYFLMAKRTGGNLIVSANDGATDTQAAALGPRGTTSTFDIGRLNGGTGDYWDGFIRPVGMWARALTAGEITSLYNGGTPVEGPV